MAELRDERGGGHTHSGALIRASILNLLNSLPFMLSYPPMTISMLRRFLALGLTLATVGVIHASAPATTATAPLADAVDWAAFLARNDLTWSQPPLNWIEGPFVGNGLLGAMIFHDPKDPQVLRLDLSRSDLYSKSGVGGIRVPTGHLELKPVGKITGVDYRLNLHDAEAVGTVRTDQGEVRWRAYVHADEPFLRLETTATGGEVAFTCAYVQERARTTRKTDLDKPNALEPEPSLVQEGPLTPMLSHLTAYRSL